MKVINFPSKLPAKAQRRDRRASLAALPWIAVLVFGTGGLLLPVGTSLQLLTLSLSACAGVSLLLSRLAVRETYAHLEAELEALRRLPEDLLERMVAYGEASICMTFDDMRIMRDTAILIAQGMGIDDEEARAIGQAAAFHDIGKVAVPASLLQKPSRLTIEEFEIVKTHTVSGSKIIGRSVHLQREREAARHHHEWWDGRGYPDGLRGVEIPLVARITAVADVFEALIARRAYKEPWPVEKAVEYLQDRSGSQFDPEVVKAFIEIYEQDGLPYHLIAHSSPAIAV